MPDRRGPRWCSEVGQTSVEYIGMILVAAAIIAMIAASDIGARITAGIQSAICTVSQSSCDETAAADRAAPVPDSSIPQRGADAFVAAAARSPGVADLAPGTLVGDLEGVGGYPSDGAPGVRAAFVKKLACKVPGLKEICKWTVDRLEAEVVKACQKSVKACRELVDKACRIGGKVCDIARKISCLVVGVLCKKPSADDARRLRLQRNKRDGDHAADRIAKGIPGSSREVTFSTSRGPRRVDVLTPAQRAIESKLGRTSLSPNAKRQIAKDVELRREAEVDSLEWRFGRSPTTGKCGPTKPLRKALKKAKIAVVETC